MHLRIRYQLLGGHVHCRVFSAKSHELTHAKNGDLVFNVSEWPEAHTKLSRIAEVLPEHTTGEEGYGHGV